MALGRLDQYLYPFYQADVESGRLTEAEATSLVACALIKLGEARFFGGDDVVNIAVGGVDANGRDATNELSFVILRAVGACNIPGPNLSARIHSGTPDAFLDECLQVIGTGLGYPALMNDEVNLPALERYGYAREDVADYCFVGCIENFLQGKQPPWSDGRFNTPKYLELALNEGVDPLNGERLGPRTRAASEMRDMDDFLDAFREQMRYGAAEYCALFRNRNEALNPKMYASPLLSCLCDDCIARALDVNDGGARYPSAHGACAMGIGTVADSLSAIERAVFVERFTDMDGLRAALKDDFVGHEALRARLLRCPKYGNNQQDADRFAVWLVPVLSELFQKYHTRDGGGIYLAMAANTANIAAGALVGATPDGRRARAALSDAASPSHGMDKNGPTAVALSVSKPDYTLVACGTVLNQKFSPAVFADPGKRARLAALIRAYFARGGQEMQINAVSLDTLRDALERPEEYPDLVVRVSGFSAYYTSLERAVQDDILERTEHA